MSSILSHLLNPADILTASTAIVEDQARFQDTLNLTVTLTFLPVTLITLFI